MGIFVYLGYRNWWLAIITISLYFPIYVLWDFAFCRIVPPRLEAYQPRRKLTPEELRKYQGTAWDTGLCAVLAIILNVGGWRYLGYRGWWLALLSILFWYPVFGTLGYLFTRLLPPRR
jgi:hypothetical protein